MFGVLPTQVLPRFYLLRQYNYYNCLRTFLGVSFRKRNNYHTVLGQASRLNISMVLLHMKGAHECSLNNPKCV